MVTGFLTDPIFGHIQIRGFLDDQAVAAAMVRTEVALAQVQADLDIVPRASAMAIAAGLEGIEVCPRLLAEGVVATGVPVPALVTKLRGRLAPKDADWLHYGATSQDIADTAMCLCFDAAMIELRAKLEAVIEALEALSHKHADTMMLARTRGQLATPISFGLRIAQWAQPLIGLEDELDSIRRTVLRVQFGGASGSRSVLGGQGADVGAGLAEYLGLADGPPWHTDRSGIRRLANWLSRCIAGLAKIGRDLAISSRGEISELRTSSGGGSSTMPHKANPVAAEALQSVAAIAVACEAGLSASAVHAEERDGGMWAVEWALMPPLFEATGAALDHAQILLDTLVVDIGRMRARIDAAPEVRSEAAVFSLSAKLGRVAAEKIVSEGLRKGRSLNDVLAEHGGDEARIAIQDAGFLEPAAAAARQIFGTRTKGKPST